MKFKKLVLLDFAEDFFDEKRLARLRALSEKLVFVNEKNIEKRNELIADADGLMVRHFTPLHREILEKMENLKYLGAASVAIYEIDADFARAKGVHLTNIAGYSTYPIAEFVFGAFISHSRRFPEALANAEKGDMKVYEELRGFELNGKKLGILGLGNIGKRVAELGLSFEMNVQYYSPHRKSDYEEKGVKYVEPDKLFSGSDLIGIFADLTEESRGMISRELISKIKESAYMLSVCHTDLFDFEALKEATDAENFIFIQTYFDTIPDAHRDALLKSPGAILYPSIPIHTFETKERIQEMVVGNVEEFCG